MQIPTSLRPVPDVIFPEEVWLVGKGPSIDKYDWSKANKYRVCINESVYVVPEPYAAIAIDYNVLDKYKAKLPDVLVFRKECHLYKFPRELVYTYKDLLDVTATAPIAIQLLYMYGAKVIHFVGFDSIDGDWQYSPSVPKGTNWDKFKSINDAIVRVCDKLPIVCKWEHRNV